MHGETRMVILNYLKAYKQEHDGCSPSYRQIQRDCNLTSVSVVSYHIHTLAKLGLVKLPEDGTRGIEIVGGRWAMSTTATPANQAKGE